MCASACCFVLLLWCVCVFVFFLLFVFPVCCGCVCCCLLFVVLSVSPNLCCFVCLLCVCVRVCLLFCYVMFPVGFSRCVLSCVHCIFLLCLLWLTLNFNCVFCVLYELLCLSCLCCMCVPVYVVFRLFVLLLCCMYRCCCFRCVCNSGLFPKISFCCFCLCVCVPLNRCVSCCFVLFCLFCFVLCWADVRANLWAHGYRSLRLIGAATALAQGCARPKCHHWQFQSAHYPRLVLGVCASALSVCSLADTLAFRVALVLCRAASAGTTPTCLPVCCCNLFPHLLCLLLCACCVYILLVAFWC